MISRMGMSRNGRGSSKLNLERALRQMSANLATARETRRIAREVHEQATATRKRTAATLGKVSFGRDALGATANWDFEAG
jgi:hypothetical protein